MYRDELEEAIRQGATAYAAMEAWLSRPIDAPDVPGALLEGYAKTLRASRETLQRLRSEHGVRDDIDEALATNEEHHRSLGLSIKGEPEPIADEQKDLKPPPAFCFDGDDTSVVLDGGDEFA